MLHFRHISRYVLAFLFFSAGLLHFLAPATFVRIVPPYLPAPLLLVYLSGAAEIVGALGLLFPATRRLAVLGLLLLLVAVFPANVYMLQTHGAGVAVPLWALWLRLPLQLLLMGGVWWVR
ncbi:DoxX family protein [Microvirga sp. STR05]|uniref:DoxX family protein n=1 Tax=Hymenobacter duratus TaxID=2771356 RepID=A0ABR8JCY6_9BACT|nr:DoxX family protein [Hymenobacter duratus]MBD2713516.1 DoxX family protein [Hymenobacter duratus]MBR7948418.1 DoxX family protein [Microvirga sp. STR05]